MGILAQVVTDATTKFVYSAAALKRAALNINVCNAATTDSKITLYLASKLIRSISTVAVSNGGSGYTAIPTITFDNAPTIAPVLAVKMKVTGAVVVTGGSGYTVWDVLTIAGGTRTTAAALTVTTVSAGVVTGVSVSTAGTDYTALPTGPVAVTGGTGTGATFTLDYGINTVSVTNGGTGFVDKPELTASGGSVNASLVATVAYATSTANVYESDTVIAANEVLERTGIVLDPGDVLLATSSPGATTITVTGLVETA